MGRIVKNFKSEQYYTRPEVIELYRQQRNIATPEVVSLRDEPSLSRFRPREADKVSFLHFPRSGWISQRLTIARTHSDDRVNRPERRGLP
ncbi:hypothetical protein FA13DRAFT_406770 [Coprinellus micaceus]|uniref:Uncharacterized protein n=1 Tax=Coprinellus micaceus TaxID=71717 RepID=A0A4Y7TXU0_COPMI|nr:hypothetical protein FA13DRAFT_406770 [Coprinellus micaceus]